MPFTYKRTIRFKDTDAAGVVYFSNILAICHEAYEESLAILRIDLSQFFSNPAIAIPIVHASVDFYRPAFCGDQQVIHLTPERLTHEEFEIHYEIFAEVDSERLLSKALTHHVCINPINRKRQPFPKEMLVWLNRWSKQLS